MLYIIAGACTGAFFIVYALLLMLGRYEAAKKDAGGVPIDRGTTVQLRQLVNVFLQRSYSWFLAVPLLRSFTQKVRAKIHNQPVDDEYALRLRTSGAVYILLLLFTGSIVILYAMNPDLIYLMTLILSAVVLQGLMLDTYVNRLQRKKLSQLIELFSGIRHAYHRHGMVDEAIYEASEEAGKDVAPHAHFIYEMLNSPNPQQQLEAYQETAPGRYLKSFAGISYMTMEYGDRGEGAGSVFLKALTGLTKEIQLDLLRLTRLDYLLKGLHVIALVPIFFTKPIERWARGNFPLMDVFYAGRYGMLTKIMIYLLIIICFLLLQKLKSEDEEIQAKTKEGGWAKRLLDVRLFRKIMAPLIPARTSSAYRRAEELIKETDGKQKVEWFFCKRYVYFVCGFVLVLCAFIMLHLQVRTNILHVPSYGQALFGSMTKEERGAAVNQVREEQQVMEQLHMSGDAGSTEIADQLKRNQQSAPSENSWLAHWTDSQIAAEADRIADKLSRWNQETLKWWEPLASLLLAAVAYYFPYWLLMFQRRIRRMDIKHEIYQFYTLIFILKEMERISVEEILEWLESFAVIFKAPLQKCLLQYEYGPEQALTEMKEWIKQPEFARLIDKLLLASGKIPVSKAFDDLDQEMGYYFEQRKQDYEKILDTKANLGKMIGFAPMYALVFMYLVIPLIWMSFTQMSVYYEQIQSL